MQNKQGSYYSELVDNITKYIPEKELESYFMDNVDLLPEIRESLNRSISILPSEERGKISDGYHTFEELYQHRCMLFIIVINAVGAQCFNMACWKTKKHHDGTELEGWFLACIELPDNKQISYHLPMNMWDKVQVPDYEQAPYYDGHTSQDVLERLEELGKYLI